jgi:predicted MFS family arabinose efflux permease
MTPSEAPSLPAEAEPTSLRVLLATFFAGRTTINTGYRMVYPFLPVIARGLGVSLEQVTLGITARSTLGLLSPIIGSTADTLGRKVGLLIGMVTFIIAMLLVFLWPTYPVLVVSLILTTGAKFLLDPAVYAFLGDRVHYKQRGFAVAVAEFGWSAAFLLGVPIVGWLMAQGGWTAPFLWLALVGGGMFLLLWRMIPPDVPHEHKHPSLRQGLKHILSHRVALAGLSLGIFISTSNEVVNIVYGAWMEDSFGLQVAALGVASAIIGIAELVGEGGVAGLVDRVGKHRAVAVGLVAYTTACLLLPALAADLNGALVGLFLFYFSFEFTLVASLPLMTELVPSSRATYMALNGAGHSLGRVIGSFVGPLMFASGLAVNAVFAAVVNIVALVIFFLYVKENHGATN